MADVRIARGQADLDAALDLRRRVFCDEQGFTAVDEIDGRDGEATHLVAVDGRGHVVATCRLLTDGDDLVLGRMAVERAVRGRGVAQDLLAAVDGHGRGAGARSIRLGAQLEARGVYARAGYAEEGDVFLDAGAEHITMRRPLG